MKEDQLAKMKATMSGATQDYKRRLEAQVDAATFSDIKRNANQILKALPAGVPLGTLTAALMLAAVAFSEGASQADRLIDQSNRP